MATMATTTMTTTTTAISQQAKKSYTFSAVKFTKKFQYHAYDPETEEPGAPKEDGRPASYVVSCNVFSRTKPHFCLHVGPDEKISPSVACVFEPMFSHAWKLGLGDVENHPDDVIWEELRKESWKAKHFSWTMTREDGTPLKLCWKRTAHHVIDGSTPSSISTRNFKLVEADGDGTILAVYTSKLAIKYYGVVQINVDWGDRFEYLALLTLATIYEAISR